jgi:hypothetical protein
MSEANHGRGPAGARFRRPLTDTELARVLAIILAEGASAGFTTLWDIVLLEAHGLTMEQAATAGLDYRVRDYAITDEQARTIFDAMAGTAGGRRLMLQAIGSMWLDKGPASFDPAVPSPAHDHSAEEAFLAYVDDPTPEKERVAELAIATLQRRYDTVLRRLDGVGNLPEPAGTHDPAATPVDCLDATLFELAGARLDDRAATLAHGLEALRELQRRPDYAGSHTVEELRRRVEQLEVELEVARAAARTLASGEDPGGVAPAGELDWLTGEASAVDGGDLRDRGGCGTEAGR